jgi:hypothetical protein
MTENQKPQLHISMLNTLSACGIQFLRRYGHRFGLWEKEEIIPPGIALVVGISTHKSVESNLRHKIENGYLLPREEAIETAVREATGLWYSGVLLTDEESENIGQTKGELLDMSAALSGLHYDHVAPRLLPVSVEEKWVVELKRFPFDLAGQIDIREQIPRSDIQKFEAEKAGQNPEEPLASIRDTKTAGKKPSPDALSSMQMAMYSRAHRVIYGKLPDMISLDYLIKTKTPSTITLSGSPNESAMSPLMARIEQFAVIIDAAQRGKVNLFTPAQPDDWRCSKKWCGFAVTCPYWSGR